MDPDAIDRVVRKYAGSSSLSVAISRIDRRRKIGFGHSVR
jgi:hypothetical protein